MSRGELEGMQYEMDVSEDRNGGWPRWEVGRSMTDAQDAVQRVYDEPDDDGGVERRHGGSGCPYSLRFKRKRKFEREILARCGNYIDDHRYTIYITT
jgi:hypothetical protein